MTQRVVKCAPVIAAMVAGALNRRALNASSCSNAIRYSAGDVP